MLRDEDDVSGGSTTYTAAVPEYRVVFYDPEDAQLHNKNWSLANGHAVHDIQHPCRCEQISYTLELTLTLVSLFLLQADLLHAI